MSVEPNSNPLARNKTNQPKTRRSINQDDEPNPPFPSNLGWLAHTPLQVLRSMYVALSKALYPCTSLHPATQYQLMIVNKPNSLVIKLENSAKE